MRWKCFRVNRDTVLLNIICFGSTAKWNLQIYHQEFIILPSCLLEQMNVLDSLVCKPVRHLCHLFTCTLRHQNSTNEMCPDTEMIFVSLVQTCETESLIWVWSIKCEEANSKTSHPSHAICQINRFKHHRARQIKLQQQPKTFLCWEFHVI